MDVNGVSARVIAAAIEVHRHLGPGLLEGTYEEALVHELGLAGMSLERQSPLAAFYKGVRLSASYRIDLVVEGAIVVELKSVDQLIDVHRSQVLTYLRLSGLSLGLLINFNVPVLHRGLKRISNNAPNLPRFA
jgi:GxxExxY protein